MDVDGKVLKYENFLNERLRSDLKKVFLANQSTRYVRNDYMIDVPPESSFFSHMLIWPCGHTHNHVL